MINAVRVQKGVESLGGRSGAGSLPQRAFCTSLNHRGRAVSSSRAAGTLRQWFSGSNLHQSGLQGLLEPRWLGPNPSDAYPVSLVEELRTCISSPFPGEADAVGPGSTL